MSAKPRIFVTRKIPYLDKRNYMDYLDIQVNEEELPLTDPRVLTKIKSADGLLVCVTDKIDKTILETARNLKVICNYAGDYSNIDLVEATKRRIYVTYLPKEVFQRATAELTIGLMLTAARRISEANNFVKGGEWKRYSPALFLGKELGNKVLGIIGLGSIGELVAKFAKGFDMKIVYYDVRRRSPDDETNLGVEYCSLEELFKISDFITIHVSLDETTRHMINQNLLRLMKKSAIIINTSRGGILDENALYKYLKEQRIAGAALDVFEREPINGGNPLSELDNVVLTPHIGGATEEARKAETEFAMNEIITVLKGGIPKKLANPEILKFT